MGRPREHDETTRAALLAAAERLIADGGAGAVSVRAVAAAAGTTTRAVYSLFGSKEGLLVDALAKDAFTFLADGIDELRETDDVVSDLIDIGLVFRRLVLEYPARYRIAFQRIVPAIRAGPELAEARARAYAQLIGKTSRVVEKAGSTGAEELAIRFNAMLEGLANAELRGDVLSILPADPDERERTWRDALTAVVRGSAVRPSRRAPKPKRATR